LPPMTLPLLGGGGVLVGSGKPGTRCARMHLASPSNWSVPFSDEPARPLFPARLLHACSDDLNAGDSVLMSFGMASPPVALGSGKFGTPCARMHCAYLSSGPPLGPVAPAWREDPQPMIAAAQMAAASEVGRRRVFVPCGVRWVRGVCVAVAFVGVAAASGSTRAPVTRPERAPLRLCYRLFGILGADVTSGRQPC
jgi:hypothetical protein